MTISKQEDGLTSIKQYKHYIRKLTDDLNTLASLDLRKDNPTTMAKPTPTFRETISFLPEDWVSGGLPDDFDALIEKIRVGIWNYAGTRDFYRLAVFFHLIPSEESGLEPFVQPYTAGDLTQFVPTMDGKTPAGATVDEYLLLAAGDYDAPVPDSELPNFEGVEFLPIGNKTGISDNSNFVVALQAFLTAEPRLREFWDKKVTFLEGANCHWNRLDPDEKTQKKRKGLAQGASADGGERKGDGKILLPTLVISMPKKAAGTSTVKTATATSKAAATTKPASKPAPAPAAATSTKRASTSTVVPDLEEEEEEGAAIEAAEGADGEETEVQVEEESGEGDTDNGDRDFNGEVEAATVELLAENGGKMTRSLLLTSIMGHFTGGDKVLSMQHAGKDEFLTGSKLWAYDTKKKVLTLNT